MFTSSGFFTDFFTIVSKVPIGETHIRRSLDEFKTGYRITGDIKDFLHPDERKINNTTFANDKEYQLYYEMQKNYDSLIRVLSTRAMPVMARSEIKKYSPKIIPGGSTSTQFGKNIKSTGSVYIVKFSTEMTNAWSTQEMIANALHNVPVIGEYKSFSTEGHDLNIIIKKSNLDD